MRLNVLAIGFCSLLFSYNTSALSFISFDSRSMALGGSGTASARPSEAAIFNPSLLSRHDSLSERKFFFHSYLGARLLDRDDFIERAKSFADENQVSDIKKQIEGFSQLFRNGQLEAQNIRAVTGYAGNLLEDVIDLSERPLRASASFGLSFGQQRRVWSFGVLQRRYLVIGAKVSVSNTDVALLRQLLTTANIVADVLDSVVEIKDLAEATGLDHIQDTIKRDIENRQVSDELRRYQDLPSVARVIDGIESLQISNDNLKKYFDLQGLYDALLRQNTNKSLEEIGLGHIRLRDYLKYQFPDNIESKLVFSGADITELAILASRRLPTSLDMAVGITLKHQHIEAIGFDQSLMNVDFKAFDEESNRRSHDKFNLDVGISIQHSPHLASGLVFKNLVPYSVRAPNGSSIDISPISRVALAYQTNRYLWSLDYDLSSNEPLGFDPDKKYLSSGFAFRFWEATMLRLGYRYNVVDSIGIPSIGMGLGFANGHFDIAATASEPKDEFGFSMQLGFRF